MQVLNNVKVGKHTLMVCVLMSIALNAIGQVGKLRAGFYRPVDKYKPGVYWCFMDGNMNYESIKKDLMSMKASGIGSVIILEINVGVPQGDVPFLSPKWFDMMKYAVKEAERLGIAISLGIGPGWTGSGGPWITAGESMQDIEASETCVSASGSERVMLPVPPPPKPFFGEEGLTLDLKRQRDAFYEDIAVLAFPKTNSKGRLKQYQDKALAVRAPYNLAMSPPFLKTSTDSINGQKNIQLDSVIDLTNKMDRNGNLNWKPSRGEWIVMRFVSRNNGAITRPAPLPGVGFEANKMDTSAIKKHLDTYIGKILKYTDHSTKQSGGGLRSLHMDSWEMGSQNWSQHFRETFIKLRGYDPLKYFPAYQGYIVENTQLTERFLWDMRLTTQDLIFKNHVNYVKKYAKKNGLNLSIEPYDMNPTSDLELGSLADVPMAEFWSDGYGLNSIYSVFEATSIGHIEGRPVVQAEAFTAAEQESWKQYPGAMKNQTDWALANGINKFVIHTYQNQFLPDSLKPGATMGIYGVHWDRSETWWPMVNGYHDYLTRCQYLLQQGRSVADILYLTPEGCPNVFVPPASAKDGKIDGDRKGFNFDGCTGTQLMRATVKNRQIVFPSGASYKILVLPGIKTMTPRLLLKIEKLVKAGAVIIGSAPIESPSLVNYPVCDRIIKKIGDKLWFGTATDKMTFHKYDKGLVISGGELAKLDGDLYPYYNAVADILKKLGYTEDFTGSSDVRYTHRRGLDWDAYFVSNRTNRSIQFNARLRTKRTSPEFWDAVSGTMKPIYGFKRQNGRLSATVELAPFQSTFIVVSDRHLVKGQLKARRSKADTVQTLNDNWTVTFNSFGGPGKVNFKTLEDWTANQKEGIKYYSGIATYERTFSYLQGSKRVGRGKIILDLGTVKNLARVKLNGKSLGVAWTAPWRVDLSSAIRKGDNLLEIEVANLWINRLIGDERQLYDGPVDGKWPEWLLKGTPRPSKRYTFTTTRPYQKDSPLQPSGLLGPVTLIREKN